METIIIIIIAITIVAKVVIFNPLVTFVTIVIIIAILMPQKEYLFVPQVIAITFLTDATFELIKCKKIN